MSDLVPAANIERLIRMVRGQKVMLDFDLAALYGVTTGHLNRSVRRNTDRFPADFMFLLEAQEVTNLIYQNGISSSAKESVDLISQNMISKTRHGGRRRPVLAFTQEGVAMLSSVLRSPRAVLVNIEIMRVFVRLRSLLAAHADLARRLDELEGRYDQQFRAVFDAIRALMAPPDPPPKPIGFHVRERTSAYRAARKRR